MKNKLIPALLVAVSLLSSCQNAATGSKGAKAMPLTVPGTVVASMSMPVNEDKLNHFSCSVKVVADSNIAAGVYDVDADYGPNFAEGQLTMPKGAGNFRLVIKSGPVPCSFIIGFKMPDDSTFYDYYEVDCSKTQTRMQYIKAYTF